MMHQLSDQQVDFILSDLLRRGIATESMRMNLLDHICILIEEELAEDGDFYQCYLDVLGTFYKEDLKELEEEAQLLMTLRKGHVVLGRNQFFLLLAALLLGPFVGYDICWFLQSGHTTGWILPGEIWASTFVFALFPLLFLVVLFLTPDRFDPLIPLKAKVLLGGRPFIRIISRTDPYASLVHPFSHSS